MTVTELTRPLNSSSTSAVRPERKPDIPWYTIGGDPEDVVSVSRWAEVGFAIYPLSLEHARTLLEFLRQEDLKTLENLLVQRAAAFDDLRQILIEEREGTVDVRFVVGGDLYDAETVVLQWIQSLRQALQHVELDFVVIPSSASPVTEWSQGGKVLYEHRTRPHRQGQA
jgi:hypothetical protein